MAAILTYLWTCWASYVSWLLLVFLGMAGDEGFSWKGKVRGEKSPLFTGSWVKGKGFCQKVQEKGLE
jgi:hypothetical protein